MRKVGFRVAYSTMHSSGSISTLVSTRGGSVGILTYQSISALLHHGKLSSSESLGFETFQLSLNISGELCIPTSTLGFFQVSDRTCQRSVQTSNSSDTLLNGGFLASHSSQHVGRHFSLASCKKFCHGYFSRPGALGYTTVIFKSWAAQRYSLYRQGFSISVCQWGQVQLKQLQQKFTNSVGNDEKFSVL